jgi:hypothetical protein
MMCSADWLALVQERERLFAADGREVVVERVQAVAGNKFNGLAWRPAAAYRLPRIAGTELTAQASASTVSTVCLANGISARRWAIRAAGRSGTSGAPRADDRSGYGSACHRGRLKRARVARISTSTP